MKSNADTPARPSILANLLMPLFIAALVAVAATAWLKTVESADSHRHDAKRPASLTATPLDMKDAPVPYTAAFLSGAVPLGESVGRIYLYKSPATARYLASVGASDTPLLAPWRLYFEQRNHAYTETDRLDAIPKSSSTVLVLPSSIALSKTERRQLLAFQEAGGSILATWASGVRDGTGEWHGYALLDSLFGVTVAGELDPQGDERFLDLHGDSPLTAGYPAGRRIWLDNTSERALWLSGGMPAATYMNWIRNGGGTTAGAAVLFDEYGEERQHARWVVFGFAETSWSKQSEELAGLLDNALHWLSRGTTVTKATWPTPYRAAYVIEMDTEEGFGNAHRFAAMMDKAEMRATFYCLISEAVRFPYLVRSLAKRHEIAYHGDVHDGFAGQPENEQSRRLDLMQSKMKSIAGDGVRAAGFRAPMEQYDRTTEHLLYAKGFLHHAADPNRTSARLPFFSPESGSAAADNALVVLPRTQHDDIGLHPGERSAAEEERLLRALNHDFHTALQAGAMGLLSIHSQYFAKDALLHEVMPRFLDEAARHRNRMWIAPANDIADWWRERERLRYRVAGDSDSFELNVIIDGARPLDKGAVIVTHRSAGVAVEVTPLQSNVHVPLLVRLDAFRTAIVFDGVATGSYSYRVIQTLPAPAMHKSEKG